MGEKTISVLVPKQTPWWVEAVRVVIYLVLASVMTMVYYQLIMARVFPGLVTAGFFPATLNLDQAVTLILGIWAIGKARDWIDKLL